MEPAALLASTFAKQPWFWGATAAIVAVLLLANVALFYSCTHDGCASGPASAARPGSNANGH
jgi:hypothetical protein